MRCMPGGNARQRQRQRAVKGRSAVHSYRHGFHAGNHADVLKHAVLVQVLAHFARKDTAFQVIDTHAGAGLYDLGQAWSRQSGEADTGIRRLDDVGTPVLIRRYQHMVAQCRAQHGAQAYPGSPWITLQALRRGDRLQAFETHASELPVLRRTLSVPSDLPMRQRTCHATDGFTALKACLPPASRRGLVIMDPSYEDKQDYRRVMHSMQHGLQRFATGCYLIWHPLVRRVEVGDMIRRLRNLPDTDWLHAVLQVRQIPRDGVGLYGSGVFVVNPPWTLHAELDAALPWLRDRLAQDAHARVELYTSQQAGGTRPDKKAKLPPVRVAKKTSNASTNGLQSGRRVPPEKPVKPVRTV